MLERSTRETGKFVTSRAEHLVSEWLQSVSLAGKDFEQIDVDQLDDRSDWTRPDLMAWSFELFEALNAGVRDASRTESTLLVVPLPYSDRLLTHEPDVARLLTTAWDEITVPGLYVFSDPQILGWTSDEEYRRVLASNPVAGASEAYYRCWRTAPSEFARALYFVRCR